MPFGEQCRVVVDVRLQRLDGFGVGFLYDFQWAGRVQLGTHQAARPVVVHAGQSVPLRTRAELDKKAQDQHHYGHSRPGCHGSCFGHIILE